MRTIVLVVIGCGLLWSGLPSCPLHAQDGGIAQLSSAAYAPDSPVQENKLFQYQTGHYGFAYNCDGEENKRNNPAICWRKADQCQLPRRMGCLERIRHDAAQVSRRILDGMCDSGCETCQQQSCQSATTTCGCGACLAKQNTTTQGTQPDELLVAKQSLVEQATALIKAEPASVKGRRSGLLSVTRLNSKSEKIELSTDDVLIGVIEVLPTTEKVERPPLESVQPPVARITSASVGSGLESVVDVPQASPNTNTQPSSLLERLKRVQSAQSADLSKPTKF